jgi:hypothetical protein
LKTILLLAGAAVVLLVGALLIRFNLKRRHVMRRAGAAAPEALEAVYAGIASLGTAASTCAVLGRTNQQLGGEDNWALPVPDCVDGWAGRGIEADAGPEPCFRLPDRAPADAVLRGRVFRLVPVPRTATKDGRGRNRLTPSGYLVKNPRLQEALAAICPRYPAELLTYLLTPGAETFEFEPSFQARLGGSPSWVQDAEFPNCPECGRRMEMILQLPGALLPGRPLPEGTFYFFGCRQHPEQTRTVSQFA